MMTSIFLYRFSNISSDIRKGKTDRCNKNNHFPGVSKEGVKMHKRISIIYIIVALVMLSMTAFLFFGSEEGLHRSFGLIQMPVAESFKDVDAGLHYSAELNLIAGICVLLLVGYLFWALYRKSQKDSQAELMAKKESFYEISIVTGRTEYDLFCKSAEAWSVSGDRIDQDFNRYLTDQVMPHYAKDFVRKNQIHLDESLVTKKEAEATSWLDWVKALLVFPGSILALFSMTALLLG